MDNRDWKINDLEATKFFQPENKEVADRFIKEVRKVAQEENHTIRFRKMPSGDIRVKIPVTNPGKFTEAEVRLLNRINKLGG